MHRYGELSKDQEPSLPLQFCSDCITATRGYDFREGQPILIDSFASRFCVLLGFYRTISYGLSLFVHTVTAVVSWRQLFDHGDWPRSAAIYLDLADLGRFRRAVPSARTGHLDSRWLASIAKRSSTDRSGSLSTGDTVHMSIATIDTQEEGSHGCCEREDHHYATYSW